MGALKLLKMVLDIIDAQPRLVGTRIVFPAPSGKGPFDLRAVSWLDRRMREQLPEMTNWVQHDFRRTWRTLMPRCGVSDTIAERTYGHRISGVKSHLQSL